jgi:hypothetical protein
VRIPIILIAIFSTAASVFLALPLAMARAGSPPALDCRIAAIIAPAPGTTIAGAVEIRGRANVPDFRFYKVEFSLLGRDDWALIGPDVIRTPVQEGLLVVWRTNLVPDGTYQLRMHVVDPTGNYCEVFLQPIIVSNAFPPTPLLTPTATETAILTVVPPQPTFTPRPNVITDVVPLQTPFLPSGNRGLPLPDINLLAFGACFLFGACGMGSVVAIIAITNYIANRNPKSDQE